MPDQPDHTPTPWRVDRQTSGNIYVSDGESYAILRVLPTEPRAQAEEIADRLVRAVNAHAGHLEALQYIATWDADANDNLTEDQLRDVISIAARALKAAK